MPEDVDSTLTRGLKAAKIKEPNGKTNWGQTLLVLLFSGGALGGGSGLIIAQNTRDKVINNEARIESFKKDVENAQRERSRISGKVDTVDEKVGAVAGDVKVIKSLMEERDKRDREARWLKNHRNSGAGE